MEFPNMERNWNKKITKYDILKKLIKYKKRWYNHVTYLWWEPFIQEVFLEALKLAKKLNYIILVTTNCTTLHIEKEAKKYLPYIDELILSVEAIDKELQQKISRTNVFVRWEEVFENINKYWNWKFFKVNIVITKDNLKELLNIVKYIIWKWVKNIAITYPDFDNNYYSRKHLLEKVVPTYNECVLEIIKINNLCNENNINLKIVDFPFCVFPKDKLEEFIKKTDEFGYDNRVKVNNILYEGKKIYFWELDRKKVLPREREHIYICNWCKYKKVCWWVSRWYEELYWYNEIKVI
jgi:MoaA/NifB/PqqE/SkfB family radical SAM enzyme